MVVDEYNELIEQLEVINDRLSHIIYEDAHLSNDLQNGNVASIASRQLAEVVRLLKIVDNARNSERS